MKVRDDFTFANLRVKISTNLLDQAIQRDEFTLQIQMPNFEILRSCDFDNIERIQKRKLPKYKTTITH